MILATKEIHLEPEAQAFADATAKPPFLFDLGPVKGREAVDSVQSAPIDKLPVEIDDRVIDGGPSGQVSIRILRPLNAPATLPVILYNHGAGWVFGNNLTHDRLIRELAVGAQAAVVFPNYSLSPEAKYPTAIEECYAVLQWIADKGQEAGLDTSRIAVAGDSVGGNMSIAVSLMTKMRQGPRIQLLLLFYPVTDAAFDTDSYHQFAEGYFLRRDAMMWFWDQYTTDPQQRNEITASPLRASIEQLEGLPPTLLINAEADVLRDEGEAFANKLRQAGVPVTAVRFQGTIHDFVMLNPLAQSRTARGAITLATAWLQDGFADQA
ncbi:MAG: esterase [Anaerolineaceae bacterium]|nr:esterase [Anaerolineaceae bacterium]